MRYLSNNYAHFVDVFRYLVNTVDLDQVVESVIEIVEHVDDVNRLNGRGDVRERYDITEQNGH